MEPSLWLVSSRTRRLERRADSRALSHSFIHTIINEMSTNYVPDTAMFRTLSGQGNDALFLG